MKKTIVFVSALLLFSFVPAFAQSHSTDSNKSKRCETSATLDGISLLWNKAQEICRDLISSGKDAKTTSGSGYVPPTVQPQQDSSKKEIAPAEKEKKGTQDKSQETKKIKPPHRLAADQMRKINSKPVDVNSLRIQIFRSAFHAGSIK